MAQAFRPQTDIALLATDHKRHPIQDVLLGVTLVFGAVAFVTAFFYNLHLLTSWTGLIGIGTGLYGQFVSVTTRERFALVIGIGASAFGFLLGMAHGGLFGGVLG
ncbi:hypothetical protein [Streptomyces bambusae]|uniref:Integral membrane protein n=1 Tax=Streptomyces bambusae TaxID=1550616 RepID=A0ABS6YZ35_9ACTN|nr:hypothetical protein [Streptomyces bambusae]MBW5480750.1 hypothetical protein [Streptomyces bambusae]